MSTFGSTVSGVLFQSLLWISMSRSINYWTCFPVIRLHMQQLLEFCFHCFNSNQPQPSLGNSHLSLTFFTCSYTKYFVPISLTDWHLSENRASVNAQFLINCWWCFLFSFAFLTFIGISDDLI